jgi:hypothetical protein
VTDNESTAAIGLRSEADLGHEIGVLRQGLWACYAVAGGDPPADGGELGSEELVALVVDCVRDLRGFFEAARRDLR